MHMEKRLAEVEGKMGERKDEDSGYQQAVDKLGSEIAYDINVIEQA